MARLPTSHTSQEVKSTILRELGNNPKKLCDWLMARILGNLVTRVEKGARLTKGQQEFLLKAQRTLQDAEIYLGAESQETTEHDVVAELSLEKLRWLRESLN